MRTRRDLIIKWSAYALASLALDGIGLTCQPLITATDGLGRLLLWVLEVISSM